LIEELVFLLFLKNKHTVYCTYKHWSSFFFKTREEQEEEEEDDNDDEEEFLFSSWQIKYPLPD
jgi:hypothetical protein